jgi:transposase
MYLRVSTQRRNGKTYRYAQLVESYRRKDGTPTNRFIASLGRRTEEEIEAIRAALEIARKGGMPVLPHSDLPKADVLHSLRYLDAAVLLRIWRQSGLQSLLADALGSNTAEIHPIQTITALVLQRCLAPASKLAACEWYPNTALPELQGIAPGQFNNSRLHRALSCLEANEGDLQDMLPQHLAQRRGAATALFLDATDTWFEGHGPPLAIKGKDKEGLFRRRVGIVLLCDEQGLPLRWHVLDGRFNDPTALANMAAETAQLPWSSDVPLVVDRALGSAGWVEKLDALGLHYVTCVPASELESCAAPIPWRDLDDMQNCDDDVRCVQKKAIAAGFQEVSKERYVLELGVFDKSRPKNAKRPSQAQAAIGILHEIESSTDSISAIAQRLNLSRNTLHRYKRLAPLSSQVRRRIENGDADGLSLKQLKEIAAKPTKHQLAELEALLQASPTKHLQARRNLAPKPPPLRVRAAISLNPRRFIEDRQADEERISRIRKRVDDVNRRLAKPQSRRKDSSAMAEVDRLIRKHALNNVCSTSMKKNSYSRRVVLHIDEKAWRRRRRSDGISLVISHPAVTGSAAERVARYFSKNEIERDFQSIKSVLGLRPVRHRTDPKLRAHVTICVLALLLSKLVEQQLEQAGRHQTLAELIERLEPIRLNLVNDGTRSYYTATKSTNAAKQIISALGLEDLLDKVSITKEITPR